MTRLIIIRHGETEWNKQGKVQGTKDNPLSEAGKEQAARLGDRFRGEHIDAIYTSRLTRAIQTAQAIADHHAHLEIKQYPELNEMDWGVWEGHTFEEIHGKFAGQLEEREKDKFHFAPKEGESPADLRRRLVPFLKDLVHRHKDKTVIIVGHGGINRVIMGIILEWDNERTATVKSKNTSVSILEVKESDSKMHLFNCTKHLEEKVD